MTGPSLIFDKSLLQALNPDESMWLDNFYTSNITTLFFVETLADLKKEMKEGKTPEQIVGSLAYKTPDTGCVNVYHRDLLLGELTGQCDVEMSGRPAVSGGQTKKLGNETGIIFLEPPESEAFRRWQKHEFLEIERTVAKKWREGLNSSTTEEMTRLFRKFNALPGAPKSLYELKILVDRIIDNPDQREAFSLGLSDIGVLPEAQKTILERWEKSGTKSIREFAPYFVYVMSVDLFYHLGTACNLFSGCRHPQTHNVDIAYLYYLPFCNIFVSNDKIHLAVSPFFMRPDQTFIDGKDFKADLAKLDQYYSSFPEETRERGVITFASIPPDDNSFLVTQMWDKYMSDIWRGVRTRKFNGTDKIDPEMDKAMHERIRKFIEESTPVEERSVKSDDAGSMIIQHLVSAQKGKWKRFPPEVINSNKRIIN